MSRGMRVGLGMAVAVVLAVLVLVSLLLSSLIDGDSEQALPEVREQPPNGVDEETAAADPSTAPSPDPDARRRGEIILWETAIVDDASKTVTVGFFAGEGGDIETDACVEQYELQVAESPEHLELTVYELLPENTQLHDESVECSGSFMVWALEAPLDNPRGDRVGYGGKGTLVTLQDMLVATAIPGGWEWLLAAGSSPGYEFSYGPVGSPLGEAQAGNAPIALSFQPGRPLETVLPARAESVSLGPGTGEIGTDATGRVALEFESDGWSYRVRGGEGVARELVLTFARKLTRYEDLATATFATGLSTPRVDEAFLYRADSDLEQFSSDQGRVSPAAALDVDLRRVRVDVPWQEAVTGGPRLVVTFDGGAPLDSSGECTWDYRLLVTESADHVTARVDGQRIIVGDLAPSSCSDTGTEWALTAELNEPLGDRTLTDGTAGTEQPTIQIETRLIPTALPLGWTALTEDPSLPQQRSTFGASDDTTQRHVLLLTSPITSPQRLTDLRRLPGYETIDIRNAADGVVVREETRTTIGFEEQGWYYRAIATPDVDVATLLDFVRSFERPALIAAGARGDEFTRTLVVNPTQPGQEKRPVMSAAE